MPTMSKTTEENQKMPAVVDVWVQLAYREDQNDDVEIHGVVFKVPKFDGDRDVHDLKKSVRNILAEDSISIPLTNTNVYRLKTEEGVTLPGDATSFSLNNCEKLKSRKNIKELALGEDDTLIVVAPKPQQQVSCVYV